MNYRANHAAVRTLELMFQERLPFAVRIGQPRLEVKFKGSQHKEQRESENKALNKAAAIVKISISPQYQTNAANITGITRLGSNPTGIVFAFVCIHQLPSLARVCKHWNDAARFAVGFQTQPLSVS